MQLVSNRFIIPVIAVIALILAACSSDHKQAERGFDYVEASVSTPLIIPEGVDVPERNPEYDIPELAPGASHAIAEAVDIRSPAQILPLVPGSRIEKTDKGIIYWLDVLQARSASETNYEMVNAVTDYIAFRGSRALAVNMPAGIVQSDWLLDRQEVERTWWFGNDVIEQYQRFIYEVDVKPHGRTVGLEVQFVDAKAFMDDEPVDLELNAFVKQRLVIVELNRLIGFVAERHNELEERLKQAREAERIAALSEQERRALLDESITLELQKEPGVSNYLALADMDKTMARMELVLPVLGFEIAEFIENTGKLYVKFDPPTKENELKYGLAGIELEEDEYIFTIGSNGTQTQITLSDEEGAVLKPHQVENLYPYFAILMKMGLDTSASVQP